jgi:hypothetical protein
LAGTPATAETAEIIRNPPAAWLQSTAIMPAAGMQKEQGRQKQQQRQKQPQGRLQSYI